MPEAAKCQHSTAKKDAPDNSTLGICSLQYYSVASHNPILSSRGRRKTRRPLTISTIFKETYP